MPKSKALRVFGYPDIHWSDRDEVALEVAKKAQSIFKPDKTIIGGDLHDCGPFSRHPQNKLGKNESYDLVETELTPVAKFLNFVQDNTRRRTVVLEGNHDEWIERWICRNQSAGRALRSLIPGNYHSRNRKNFTWVPFTGVNGDRMSSYHLRHDLIVTHGWCAPKYAAQHHLDKAKNVSVIYNHTHRADYRAGVLWGGKVIEAMSAGCLCKRIPIYAHNGSPTDWTHGFWVAYLGRKSYTAYTVMIRKNYAVLPDGTEIQV